MRKVLLTFELYTFDDVDSAVLDAELVELEETIWDAIDASVPDVGRVVDSWTIVGPDTKDGRVTVEEHS